MFEQFNLMIEKLTASQAVVLALVLLAFVALATVLDWWCNSRSRSGETDVPDGK